MNKPCDNCVYKDSGQCSCEQLDKYELYIKAYNQALDDFAKKMNRMLSATDLRDNGYYIENLVSIAKNELKNRRINMTREEYEKEKYFADTVLGAIENVRIPMLMYEEEKQVVKKALKMYKNYLENEICR